MSEKTLVFTVLTIKFEFAMLLSLALQGPRIEVLSAIGVQWNLNITKLY